ncbi:hypothetical protein ACQEU3_35575 [Spirillospora sp. CA-253888]
MDKVARRAGTNKNTIYRRWPHRAALGEASPEAVHPRVASLPMTLLRGEYALKGLPEVPDAVLIEIVDEVLLPLVRGRAPQP